VRHFRETLKFKLTILFFASAIVTYGQSNLTQASRLKLTYQQFFFGKNYVEIDNSNHQKYFEKVKDLTEFADKDSSYKATKLMWALWFYDTSKYSIDFFKLLLDKIVNSNKFFCERTLKGQWQFSHDFWTGLVSQVSTSTNNKLKVWRREILYHCSARFMNVNLNEFFFRFKRRNNLKCIWHKLIDQFMKITNTLHC
jgi:hypothetical protein